MAYDKAVELGLEPRYESMNEDSPNSPVSPRATPLPVPGSSPGAPSDSAGESVILSNYNLATSSPVELSIAASSDSSLSPASSDSEQNLTDEPKPSCRGSST